MTYENRFLVGKKPTSIGQIFVGFYGFSCRRITGVHYIVWNHPRDIMDKLKQSTDHTQTP